MPDAKITKKVIDMAQANETLDALMNTQPEGKGKSSSLRQSVISLYPKIKELLDAGWTRDKICEYLKKALNIEFSNATFFSYLTVAKKGFEAERKRKNRKSREESANADAPAPPVYPDPVDTQTSSSENEPAGSPVRKAMESLQPKEAKTSKIDVFNKKAEDI